MLVEHDSHNFHLGALSPALNRDRRIGNPQLGLARIHSLDRVAGALADDNVDIQALFGKPALFLGHVIRSVVSCDLPVELEVHLLYLGFTAGPGR